MSDLVRLCSSPVSQYGASSCREDEASFVVQILGYCPLKLLIQRWILPSADGRLRGNDK